MNLTSKILGIMERLEAEGRGGEGGGVILDHEALTLIVKFYLNLNFDNLSGMFFAHC